jgi:hypothetical protein
VDIREALAGVGSYSHRLGRDQAAQQHLQALRRQPPKEFPLGLRILVSGSGQSLPVVPWLALLDDDVTDTAQDGLYLCYLYRRDTSVVYLSMNQGATQHLTNAQEAGLRGKEAERSALTEITAETLAMRELVGAAIPEGTTSEIDLDAAQYYLPVAYEAGNIAAIEYQMAALPNAATLADDLAAFASLYSACVDVKDELAANRQVGTSARSAKKRKDLHHSTPQFKPKNSADYLANVTASTQRRTRKHEALLEEFASALKRAGHIAANNVHPRDLVIHAGCEEWLVEAKTVRPNAEEAVRAAIGQLFSYRHFYYRELGHKDPQLLALFDTPIGLAFQELLETLGIAALCRDGAGWQGSSGALALLVNTLNEG